MPQYYDRPSTFKKIMTAIIVIALIGLLAYVAGLLDFWKMPSWIPKPSKIAFSPSASVQQNHEVVAGIQSQGWCLAQQIQVENSNLKPVSVEIMGWDSVEQCCLKRVMGFNCALNRTSEMKYCYTSQVNGEIKYVTLDDVYAGYEPNRYLLDFQKEYVPNRPCDDVYYPISLQR